MTTEPLPKVQVYRNDEADQWEVVTSAGRLPLPYAAAMEFADVKRRLRDQGKDAELVR